MNNVVGKMLIVMQLVFSILFMCFAGAVYTFQGAWRNKAVALQSQLDGANKQVEDANTARDRETKQLNADLDAARTDRDAVRAQLEKAVTQAQTNQQLLAAASQERDKALADGEIATAEAAARVVETTAVVKERESLRKRITDLIKEIQNTEDQLLDSNGKLASAVEMEEQYLGKIGHLNDLLRLNEIDPGQQLVGIIPAEIEKVDGFVDGTTRNQARTQELIQITIGSDDKIYKDMVLTVYRKDDYICQARVVKVYPDTAICMVEEKTRNGNVQRGDNVTTKL